MVTMRTIQSPRAFLPLTEKYSKKTPNFKHFLRTQFSICTLCELINLSLQILKIQFLWGWVCQILKRDK